MVNYPNLLHTFSWFYKRFLCLCCILPVLFLISGCSGKTDIEETQTPEDITIFYEADSGSFKKDTYVDYSKDDTVPPPEKGPIS